MERKLHSRERWPFPYALTRYGNISGIDLVTEAQ